jgi:hypothetical protein
MSPRLVFALFVLAFACRPPARVLIIETAKHCQFCNRETGVKRDSFKVVASYEDVWKLGLQDFAKASVPQSQEFTASQIRDSLKLGRRHYAMATFSDTCESCANAYVRLHVGTIMVCRVCGKHYSTSVSSTKLRRKDVSPDTVKLSDGFCGSKACRPKQKHPEWNLSDCQDIAQGRYRIGFTAEQVVAAIGRPDRINRTVTGYSTSEQWIYGDWGPYLYIDDGKLTSWQD